MLTITKMATRLDRIKCYRFATGMKSIHIRGVSESTLLGLKRRAARHRRSLQKEVQFLLEEAAQMQTETTGELKLHLVETGNSGTWSREDIYGNEGR